MGLDMYLKATKYISGSEYGEDKGAGFRSLVKRLGLHKKDIAGAAFPHAHVSITVGYWRKANAVHAWFVREIQKGEDNCAEYWVSVDRLRELRGICANILAAHKRGEDWVSIAQRDLPPQAGFFFGSTDVDEYYLSDLRDTVNIIDGITNSTRFKGWDFHYQSSW